MTWPSAIAFETSRFTLEPLSTDHAAEMIAVLADPALYEFTGGEPPSPESLRARYVRQSPGHSPEGDAGWLNWIIRDKGTGAPLGYVQATITRSDGSLTADLAWLVAPAAQGNSVATESSACVLAWLRAQGVETIRAHIHPDHGASARVAQRLGLEATSVIADGERLWQASIGPE